VRRLLFDGNANLRDAGSDEAQKETSDCGDQKYTFAHSCFQRVLPKKET
jgi:hypothetical protein